MRRLWTILSVVLAILVAGFPAFAQSPQRHAAGPTAISADGRYVAFTTNDMSATEFFLLDSETGRAFRMLAPQGHLALGDLVWTRTGSTLMFVSVARPATRFGDSTIYGGYATHIWAIDVTPDGPGPGRVLAKGDGVRLPALSPDGSHVAYFLPVRLPREGPDSVMLRTAFAVFETDLATGAVTRVAPSQFSYPRALFYDGPDRWFFSAQEPAYLNVSRDVQFWGPRPAPSGKGTFDQLTDGIKSFRLQRGETLPDYPGFKEPYPAMGTAPIKSLLVGQTLDGNPILFGSPGPENTAANQTRNMYSNYIKGMERVEMAYGYVAFDKDGKRSTTFIPPTPPKEFELGIGGNAVDGSLRRYLTVRTKSTVRGLFQPDDPNNPHRVFLYDGGQLLLQKDVRDIAASASRVQLVEPEQAGPRPQQ